MVWTPPLWWLLNTTTWHIDAVGGVHTIKVARDSTATLHLVTRMLGLGQQGGGFWQNMTTSTLPLRCFAEKQASLLSSLDSYDRRAPGREGNGGVGNYTTAHQIDQVKQDSALIEIGSGRHRNAVCYRINGPGENRIALSANALWIGVAAPYDKHVRVTDLHCDGLY